MKRILRVFFRTLFPKYGNYAVIVYKNKLKKWFKPKIENKHLFILSPPYCGSTLINEIISTSSSVSVNNSSGTREGQTLPTVKHIMFNRKNRWDETVSYDWVYIRKEWMKYWDTTKPILLEKSPTNIIRAKSINETFPNSSFVIFFRNPYSQCQSLIKRNNYNAKDAAEFAITCLKYQEENIKNLSNSIVVSYEDLTNDPAGFTKKISTFLPELKDIKTDIKFNAHNFKEKPLNIKNLNSEKFKLLSQSQLDEINECFMENIETLKYFNYDLIKATNSIESNAI